jgi:hypothetical protein
MREPNAERTSPGSNHLREVLGVLRPFELRWLRTLLRPYRAGEKMAASWYEYPARSNYDRSDRERLGVAAEAAGFVEYRSGHPWLTEAGERWARAE